MTGQLLRIRGLVQGVGFRPYVWRLAGELGLAGWVRNDGAGVTLTVGGEKVAEFRRRLPLEIPPLARIDAIDEGPAEALAWADFRILDSADGAVATAIGPDAATCPDCLADLCDPAGRRWRYAFTTCTHCGPRYTVSAGMPYDRARTSLADFPLCPACAAEYANPADRRFHAETTCCPACGPRLTLSDAFGQDLTVDRQSGQKSAATGAASASPDELAAASADPVAATLLEPWLNAGQTIVLLGSSGTGKSTLTNTLLGSEAQPTGAVRAQDSRGRHTTTARSLFRLPQGACVIDTTYAPSASGGSCGNSASVSRTSRTSTSASRCSGRGRCC